MLKSKKGFTISDLAPIAVAFVIITVVISMGAVILTEINETDTVSGNANASSIVTEGIDAMDEFAGWFDILVIVVIAAVIIGIILYYFSNKGGAGGV
jgi:hypothetical protein